MCIIYNSLTTNLYPFLLFSNDVKFIIVIQNRNCMAFTLPYFSVILWKSTKAKFYLNFLNNYYENKNDCSNNLPSHENKVSVIQVIIVKAIWIEGFGKLEKGQKFPLQKKKNQFESRFNLQAYSIVTVDLDIQVELAVLGW